MRLTVRHSLGAGMVIASMFVGMRGSAQEVSIDASGKIRSQSGGFVFPDGSTQTTAMVATTYTIGDGLALSGTTISIAPSGVQTSMLAAGAVTMDTLADGAVTSSKLAPPTGYLFAYTHTNPTAGPEWVNISFDTVSQADGWTPGDASFTCDTPGLYLIQYTAEVSGGIARPASIRAMVNGDEISGSQSTAKVDSSGVVAIAKSFIASLVSGDLLRFQFAGTLVSSPARLVPNSGSGDVRPSFSITVVKIR